MTPHEVAPDVVPEVAPEVVHEVLDAHQHFWAYNEREYGWMSDDMDVLRTDHLPEHLEPLLAASGVHGTIAVQARRSLNETAWLLELAHKHDFIRGVVGWVDMASPKLEEDLERFAADPALVGVRELIHDMTDPMYALSDQHVQGVGLLASHGLAYDLLVRPQHLPAATRLVDRFPEQRFVVDHAGKPAIAAGLMEPWAEDLARLAERPNVTCKLSGLVTEADWYAWEARQIKPYLDHVLAVFGPERVMIGSDWPVCTCAADYRDTMALVLGVADELTSVERAAVLGGTCARIYDLDARRRR